MLSREQLLGSFVRKYRTVPTPVGEVRIRNLTEGEKSDFESGSLQADGKLSMAHVRSQRRKLVALTVVDDQGQLVFSQPGDVDRLKNVDGAVTTAIFKAAREHCGFEVDELDATEKNCGEAGESDSPTA